MFFNKVLYHHQIIQNVHNAYFYIMQPYWRAFYICILNMSWTYNTLHVFFFTAETVKVKGRTETDRPAGVCRRGRAEARSGWARRLTRPSRRSRTAEECSRSYPTETCRKTRAQIHGSNMELENSFCSSDSETDDGTIHPVIEYRGRLIPG